MSTERLLVNGFVKSDAPTAAAPGVSPQGWIFDELPMATVVSVSGTDTADISPMVLSYTFELQYKQFKWRLAKKASQVLYLHFALKKRAIIEEFHEKQEQVKEWLQSFGVIDHAAVVEDEDEPDDGAIPLHHEESTRTRYVPSVAALPILRPSLGGKQSVWGRAKAEMQGYLNLFLGNLDIVNSREHRVSSIYTGLDSKLIKNEMATKSGRDKVCKFLEVSKLSFSGEYGPKLKEGYVTVGHLSQISNTDTEIGCCPCRWLSCCSDKWIKVWAVLKPGFFALLEDPFETKLLDIIVFDVQQSSNGKEESRVYLAEQIKERNPLHYAFKVSCGNQSFKLRTSSKGKVKQWIAAISDAGLGPLEGWCRPHRFSSFAPPRGLTDDGIHAQWYIDGEAAFDAIASAIENAKLEIFITGWWLCPELYLRRPFQSNSSSRLDKLLEEKAKQGVQIYILLYKEVALALKINSLYSKNRLLKIHENVRVLRYPDHLSTGIYLWSHHEKLVIVDHQICFIGGLDLCFGRYDTIEHKVGDCPPDIWPGKDYYNPRESEPNSWEDTMIDELDRHKYPRMPWHDVHCALWGPPCRDAARHFVQRWNHAKRNKAPNEQTIPLLMPRHHMVIPHYMGRGREINIESKSTEDAGKDVREQTAFPKQSLVQDIPFLLPQEADGAVVNSSGAKKLNGTCTKHNLIDQPTGNCGKFSFSSQKSETETLVQDTQTKRFADDIDFLDLQSETILSVGAQTRVKLSDEEWGTSDDGDPIHETGQVGPCTACHCQIIRSVSQWSAGTSQVEESIHNAYCSLIEKAEHFIYIENQFFISGHSGDEIIQNRVLEALYKRILLAHKEQKCFRVIVVLPLIPGFQGGIDDGDAATVRAIMHWQYRTISREKTSILHNLNALLGSKSQDYISFYGLRSYGRLFDGGPVATSQVYVHSKLMIVDDRVTLIGSSNINDRSLLGSRDSEIGVVIEDKEFTESSMNGKPWKAGKFAYSLRSSLWSEHLGLQPGDINRIIDPVRDSTYKDLWLAAAQANTKVYQDVFGCIPNELIHSRAALRQSTSHWKEKLGYTTIDLTIAPERVEFCENGESKTMDPMERLKSIRGHLVSFPLNFMCQEDLRPMFNEGEFYVLPQVFH